MSYHRPPRSTEGDSALGPMLGIRRPRYEVLNEHLAPWLALQPTDNDLAVFINLTSTLRHLFSEFSVAKLSRGELNRHPRLLAAELVNIAGHYRHYAHRFFGLPTTVFLYHSSRPCASKLELDPGYKAAVYAKRTEAGAAGGEYEVLRRYVEFNVGLAKTVFERIPHAHLVDTGEVDPEAWPMTLLAESRVRGPSLVVSSYACDLQYALGDPSQPLGPACAVLHANGDHTRVVTRGTLLAEALRSSKTGAELAGRLAPEHFLYLLALAGDEDLGVRGIQKVGMAKAARLVAKAVESGRLPPDAPGIAQLVEDGNLPPDAVDDVRRAWQLLVHQSYASTVPPHLLSAIDAQIVNRSGLGELEQANARFFEGVLNLEMAFAGETGY